MKKLALTAIIAGTLFTNQVSSQSADNFNLNITREKDNNSVKLNWDGTNGVYHIYSTTNLLSTNWNHVNTIIASSETNNYHSYTYTFPLTTNMTSKPIQFFKVVKE